ncbi:S-adenosyl-L-methionine-dependent methyltransferase [Podospora didyma]|uniref:S-adenosyl-L-methionine-dependent methyltransferase n=1 Tax=Podospora didyma TaxID=330526 RepID=A0AAE0P7U3_9PEZI|nr:S-adenosyl-L-methionine-dependent methyltransferase [Podospora didyma]
MSQGLPTGGYESINPITVDDGDSFLGSDTTSTTSLSPSVINYREHHGRTYSNYKDVEDCAPKPSSRQPNDEKQQGSLDIMHQMMLIYDKGNLFQAPVENPQCVLDVGTGTGIWAVDFASRFQSASVTGTDLSPIQPEWVPPNCSFELDNANLKWNFPDNEFDFVHGSITDWKEFYGEAYRCLKPGGWIEHIDASATVTSDDSSIPPDCKTGKTFNPIISNKAWMEAVGFTELQIQKRKMPIGNWPKDELMKEVGGYNLLGCEEGLEGYGQWIMSQQSWTDEKMQVVFSKTREAMRDRKIHTYYLW